MDALGTVVDVLYHEQEWSPGMIADLFDRLLKNEDDDTVTARMREGWRAHRDRYRALADAEDAKAHYPTVLDALDALKACTAAAKDDAFRRYCAKEWV